MPFGNFQDDAANALAKTLASIKPLKVPKLPKPPKPPKPRKDYIRLLAERHLRVRRGK